MDVSVIIVNWHSVQHLGRCLEALEANTAGATVEVIVLDNASYDGSAEMVAGRFPRVRFIQGSENVGFARANNEATLRAKGRLLLFLNPDTVVVGPAILQMTSVFETDSTVGIVGCRVLNPDMTLQATCVQAFPTIANELLDAEWLRRRTRKASAWGMAALFDEHHGPVAVQCVSGACLMIRRTVFETVGRFTADYFMYVEDRDLCYKVKQAGYNVYYLESAEVIHYSGASSGACPRKTFATIMRCQSLMQYMRLHKGTTAAAAYRGSTAVIAMVRLTIFVAMLVGGKKWRRTARYGLAKWVSVFRWAVGLEQWASHYSAHNTCRRDSAAKHSILL